MITAKEAKEISESNLKKLSNEKEKYYETMIEDKFQKALKEGKTSFVTTQTDEGLRLFLNSKGYKTEVEWQYDYPPDRYLAMTVSW